MAKKPDQKEQLFANLVRTKWPMAPDPQPEIAPSPASPTPSNDPPKGLREWYEAVAKRSNERGPMLDDIYKALKATPSPPSPTPSSEPQSPTKVTGRARERIIDELEATLDALRAEMEALGPRLRGRNPLAAKLFLALDRMSRETREMLSAMRDAESATQH